MLSYFETIFGTPVGSWNSVQKTGNSGRETFPKNQEAFSNAKWKKNFVICLSFGFAITMNQGKSFEEREALLRSDDRRYKSMGSVHQNKCKIYKRRWYILAVFSVVAALNNLIWNTWGPIQGTSQVVFGWDSTTITLLADWGPISFVVTVVPMCWLMDMKGKWKKEL